MATAARHSDVLKNIPAGRSASFILEHRLWTNMLQCWTSYCEQL
jgi:hypothetical protein